MADDPFFYVILVACLVVLGILAWGLGTFQAGGDGKKSNKIMTGNVSQCFPGRFSAELCTIDARSLPCTLRPMVCKLFFLLVVGTPRMGNV